LSFRTDTIQQTNQQIRVFISLCIIIGSDGPERDDAVPELPPAPRPGAAGRGTVEGRGQSQWRRRRRRLVQREQGFLARRIRAKAGGSAGRSGEDSRRMQARRRHRGEVAGSGGAGREVLGGASAQLPVLLNGPGGESFADFNVETTCHVDKIKL
jgi:hypothetical protein